MAKILIIDDDKIYLKMIEHALASSGHELSFTADGVQGLAQANVINPDLLICDVMMPALNGYEVVRRLRRDDRFAKLPIMLLTAQTDLNEKLAGFEAGADDYMTKPFAPTELTARVENLLKKSQSETAATLTLEKTTGNAHILAVHNLRGGVGNSTVAVNLGVGLYNLWEKPTILVDMVLTAGQVALMMNASLRRTWADLANHSPEMIDIFTLHSIISHHDLGVDIIAAPTFPPEADLLTTNHFIRSFALLKEHYEYIVVDLPHDFRESAYNVLDISDEIIVVISPEMASVRSAAAAIETYKKLGYSMDKIKLVLNWTFERNGLARKNIEAALHHPVLAVLPFTPDVTIEAINYGKPFIASRPVDEISMILENLAFFSSKESHRNSKPAAPSKALQRTAKRLKL